MWQVETIRENILTNDRWTIRGLMAIYNYQTEQEKDAQETLVFNNVGFNGADGKLMSSMAEFYKRNNYLTEKQIALVRRRLEKYAGQLTKIANKNI